MRFTSLKISNLRAIRQFEVEDLRDFIVIAGPNGCGKSCLFDAIRLLKSAYGGAEYEQWFGEFQINLNRADQLRRMFRDPSQPVEVSAAIRFSDEERAYLADNATDLLWPYAWQRVTNQRVDYASFSRASVGPDQRHFRQLAESNVEVLVPKLTEAVAGTEPLEISISVLPDGTMTATPCLPAEVVFPNDVPEHLGIIEYHSASRSYSREQIGGVNLDPSGFETERRQHRLFNWQAKYQNVKTELLTGYLRGLIADQAGRPRATNDLNDTLKELFRRFFPDKEYLGIEPRYEGLVEFPVRLPGGETHDIDDLSSGEKEILYGYLRLRNSTPRHSVVLLDEPELHLNPGLLEGFADFYYRHLGLAQDNQLWLVTHSDRLLRQAIGNANYGVYHMQTASTADGNQASEVVRNDDLERAVSDLVGDLAAYQPHAKVVILEGATNDGFDEELIRRLFPDFAKRVNLVSGESKKRVTDLYEALNGSAEKMGIRNRFFAIFDRDAEGFREGWSDTATATAWEAYHIENYLLDPCRIREAAAAVAGGDLFDDEGAVMDALHTAASALVDRLVLQEVQAEVYRELSDAISVGASPETDDIPRDLAPSIESTMERLADRASRYDHDELTTKVDQLKAEFTNDLTSDQWLKRFPGRAILQRFVGANLSCDYMTFRNVLIDKMVLAETQPAEMKAVLDRIIEA